MGWRDIARRNNLRTFITTIFPRTAAAHYLPVWLAANARKTCEILCTTAALVEDYIARHKVGGTHLTFFIVNQLPMPHPSILEAPPSWSPNSLSDWLLPRAMELLYTAWDLEGFATELGYNGPPFMWDAARRLLLRAELDAAFFHLYGVSRDDADYILDTFPIVRANDEKKYGSYRTKEVILDIYDRMAKAAEGGTTYETVLDPPPAHPSVAHPASSQPAWATVEPLQPQTRPALTIVDSPPEGKNRERFVRVVNLRAAAGGFGVVQDVEPEGWLELSDGRRLPDGAFVAQVVGHSMEPTIPDDTHCVFAPPRGGSRAGKILIVQHRDIADPESGGSYTIKRYRSEKGGSEDALWENARIILEPINPDFKPIELTPADEGDVRVVGEFLRVVS